MIDDQVARGLALLQLGTVLLVDIPSDEKGRLAAAAEILSEAAKLLSATGFHRGSGEAHRWLAECYHLEWKAMPDPGTLAKSIVMAATGVVHTTLAVQGSDGLQAVFDYLRRQLDAVL